VRLPDGLAATAVLVDRFGNVALNLDADELEAADIGDELELVIGGERYHARVARAFGAVRASDILVLVDSYGMVSVAVNSGSAAEVLTLEAGDRVVLRRQRRR
jgi:S-adenosylmethionine hydrolase